MEDAARSSELREEQRGGARWLVLHRPDRRNALTPTMVAELRSALARADADDSTRVVCLTGSGDKAFCAGADLATVHGGGAMAAHEARRSYAALLSDLARLGKPVVACVNGAAVGGGLGIVAACDLAVAADDATLGTPEIEVALFPYMVLAPLTRVVGRRAALELVLTGRRIGAQEALRIGLVNSVAPRTEVAARAQALCDELAAKSPAALRLGRRAFYATQDLPYEAQLEALAAMLGVNALAEDAHEGIGAFLEKRKAQWKGR
jgi:enoyl-CoA hydratase/carnithine racemase